MCPLVLGGPLEDNASSKVTCSHCSPHAPSCLHGTNRKSDVEMATGPAKWRVDVGQCGKQNSSSILVHQVPQNHSEGLLPFSRARNSSGRDGTQALTLTSGDLGHMWGQYSGFQLQNSKGRPWPDPRPLNTCYGLRNGMFNRCSGKKFKLTHKARNFKFIHTQFRCTSPNFFILFNCIIDAKLQAVPC